MTKLPEIGYMEELHDEDWYEKSYIWFYGEWLGSEEANVESNLKTMAMRIRDLLKESNHAQWKEVDDFLKQYEHMHVCDEKLIRRMVCKYDLPMSDEECLLCILPDELNPEVMSSKEVALRDYEIGGGLFSEYVENCPELM